MDSEGGGVGVLDAKITDSTDNRQIYLKLPNTLFADLYCALYESVLLLRKLNKLDLSHVVSNPRTNIGNKIHEVSTFVVDNWR